MTRQIGLVEQINHLLQRGVPAPDNRIGSQQQQRIAERTGRRTNGVRTNRRFHARSDFCLTNRDLSVASSGGAVVQTDIKSEIEAFLQPYSAVIRLGATVLNGLKGNSQVPIGRAGVTTQWGSKRKPQQNPTRPLEDKSYPSSGKRKHRCVSEVFSCSPSVSKAG